MIKTTVEEERSFCGSANNGTKRRGGERGLVTHVLCQSSSPYSGLARLQSCVKK